MNEASSPTGIDPSDLTFRFDSGRLCLNAVASVGGWRQDDIERWRTPEDLGRWCVEAGLLTRPPEVSEAELAEARALRESTYRLVQSARSQQCLAQNDVEVLNSWAARPALVPELAAHGNDLIWRAEAPLEAVLASIARDAVELLAGDLIGRIRECAAPECTVLFIDGSRPGKRRWCSMNRCGNRVKKQAFRQRQKVTTDGPEPH